MKSVTLLPTLRSLLFAAGLVFMFTNCSNEEQILSVDSEFTETATPDVSDVDDGPAGSITIDGINTLLASTTDCSCAYVVPASASIVDGKKLGIKAGSAICLDNSIKYGNLTFINLEGTAERPIIIAYGVERFTDLTVNPDILRSME